MKPVVALFALMLGAGAAHAAGSVQVSFVKSETFTDMRDRAYTVEANLKALEKVVVDAASSYVADGQTLKIEVVDVDLAGETRPGPRARDVRVLRGGADWPRITLRWRLEGGSAAPRSGQAVVQDMAYLQRVPAPLADGRLVYEQRMLNEWFREQFGKAAPAG